MEWSLLITAWGGANPLNPPPQNGKNDPCYHSYGRNYHKHKWWKWCPILYICVKSRRVHPEINQTIIKYWHLVGVHPEINQTVFYQHLAGVHRIPEIRWTHRTWPANFKMAGEELQLNSIKCLAKILSECPVKVLKVRRNSKGFREAWVHQWKYGREKRYQWYQMSDSFIYSKDD